MLLAKLGRKQPRLKLWIELETYKEKILKAADGGELPKWMLLYISAALWGIDYKYFELASWTKIVSAFYFIISQSPKLELPLLSPTDEKQSTDDWSYDGRTWHLYSHMLAKSYGWTLEYISCLHVEEALAKIEEIMVDEQLEREFYYGLSENAYSYDQRTKKSKFVPLPRPHWMRKKAKPIQKFLIPASMLPQGLIKIGGVLPDEYLPKEINPN